MNIQPFSTVKHAKEFYSATVRFSLGLFLSLYIWLGMVSGEFAISQTIFNNFVLVFFAVTMILALDLFRNPESGIRRFFTLFFDISCTSYATLLTGGVGSEFILIYIWLYIAYGTRYGLTYLLTAVILVMLQYNMVLILDNAWSEHLLSSAAQLFILILMPLYLYSLITQLRQAKKEAEQATRAKSNFLATMSHEIRTPMSGIIGTAHLLQNTRQNKEQKEYTRALLDASKSLHALIGDILDFSKIEANKLELQTCPFDLHHCINEVLAVLSPNAEYHQLDFVAYIDPQLPPYVIGDNQRIRQILFNLLGNAIKFTEKGEVSLKVTAKEPVLASANTVQLLFDIRDTGIGISSAQQPKIFDSFTQAEDLHTHKFGGTGLGTTISKQLVEFMGGEIGVNSKLGQGSHFWFTLPLPVENTDTIKQSYYQQLADKTIAIITTHNTCYDTLQSYCQYLGLSVQRFYSQSELLDGLQQANEQNRPFDLIILSHDNQQDSPINLAQQINALNMPENQQPKKVFLSYLSQQANAQRLGGSLFDAYITKPINFERLGTTLVELLLSEPVKTDQGSSNQTESETLNILIAEDEDINAMVLESFLKESGHTTVRVENGAQAVEALSRQHFDLAFMDMRMPEMNGLDATKIWRAREPQEQQLPIIALTANATVDDRQACMEAGMNDFITKPISPEQLSSIIQKFCTQHKPG